jgi:hypothetical protein
MTERKPTLPRFRRTSDQAENARQGFRLTEDDIAILWHVYRNRLIDSDDIYRLLPHRSKQQLSRRLNAMFRDRFLGRPPEQLRLVEPGTGSRHIVYGLDKEGARILRDRFGTRVPIYHWVQKNNEIGKRNIAHTLSTTRFMVDLELAARKRSDIRIIPFDELLQHHAPARTREKHEPDRWRAPVNWKGQSGEEGTQPDQIFALEYLHKPHGQNRVYFYLEIDQGNETVTPGEKQQCSRAFFRSSSILRKMVVYGFSHREKLHERLFGFTAAPRVLTVTTSKVRAASMREAYVNHIQPKPLMVQPGLFLFASRDELSGKSRDPLSIAWLNGLGKPVHIDGR